MRRSRLARFTVLVAVAVMGLGIGAASADEYDDWCEQDDNWMTCANDRGELQHPQEDCYYIPYGEMVPGGPHIRCVWEY